jgi:hypothetical protein
MLPNAFPAKDINFRNAKDNKYLEGLLLELYKKLGSK